MLMGGNASSKALSEHDKNKILWLRYDLIEYRVNTLVDALIVD